MNMHFPGVVIFLGFTPCAGLIRCDKGGNSCVSLGDVGAVKPARDSR